MNKITTVLTIAMLQHGKPYIWGGQTPLNGFDCSGLVVYTFRSVGLLKDHEDYTAAGFYEKYKEHKVEKPCKGCLAFYKNSSGKISHIGIMLDKKLVIEAAGGNSRVKTLADAIEKDAHVKIRPYQAHGGFFCFLDPLKIERSRIRRAFLGIYRRLFFT